MILRVLFIAFPAVTFVLGIPLILRLVPPNRFYGFRTATSFSSAEAWYQINFAAGACTCSSRYYGRIFSFVSQSRTIYVKPEVRYLVGILFTAIVTLAFLV